MNNLPILYHGTDARLIEMPEEERKDYFEDVRIATDYLWNIFKPYYEYEMYDSTINGQHVKLSRHKIKRYEDLLNNYETHLYDNLLEKFAMLHSRDNGSELYQYKHLYFTSLKEKAVDFARNSFAGGESGLMAYRLIQVAEALKWVDVEEYTIEYNAIKNVKTFAESDAKPVIIPIVDIDIDYLFDEEGKELIFYNNELLSQNLRYTKEYKLSLEGAEYLK